MILGLDGLRAIAFLLVFGFHTGYIPFGWLGVQLFFVLSGFLITDILLRMKETLPGGRYFIVFYLRRFLRIFPLYYFFLFSLMGVAAWAITIHYKPAVMKILIDQIWYALFYVYDFFSTATGYLDLGILDHLWSLSVEEQFYIVWPLLIFLVPKKALKKLFIIGIIVGLLSRVVLFLIVFTKAGPLWQESAPLVIYFLPFSHVDAFSFGAYISRFSIQNAPGKLKLLLFVIPIAGIVSHFIHLRNFDTLVSFGYMFMLPAGFQFIWGYTLMNYFFMILLYNVIFEKRFLRILEFPFLRYLGKISYGLYVFHYPLIWFVEKNMLFDASKELQSLYVLVISFAGTFVLTSLSYIAFEKPFLKLKDRFAKY